MNRATSLLAMIVTLAVALGAPARAQQQPATAAAKEGVWRYVDASTLMVAWFDVEAFDRGAAEQWLTGIVKANVKDARTAEDVTRWVHDNAVLSYPDQLKQAGAKEAFFVLSLSDVPNGAAWLVVPVPAGADAGKIQQACFPPGMKPGPAAGAHSGPLVLQSGSLSAATIGDVVILSAGSPERFRQFQAVDRPDLAAALKAAGDGRLVAALAPNEDTRKVVEQMMPQLPPPASAPSTVLTRGLRYASLSANFPPQQKLDVVVQASDAAAAGALHDLVVRVLDVPRKDRGFHEQVPQADQIIDAFTPKVDGDRLVLSFDAAGADRVASLLATGMTKAHDAADRVKSLSNLKQIGLGVMMYRNEHKGAFPDDIAQTAKYFSGPGALDKVMVNPAHPERKSGYVYVKPAGDPTKVGATDTVLAYEWFDQWPGHVGVLFVDGHAEQIADQKRFDSLLAKAKAGAK